MDKASKSLLWKIPAGIVVGVVWLELITDLMEVVGLWSGGFLVITVYITIFGGIVGLVIVGAQMMKKLDFVFWGIEGVSILSWVLILGIEVVVRM